MMNWSEQKKIILKRLRYNPLQHKNQNKKKGVALIMAMTSLMLMVYIASEVSRDSSVEFIVNSNELARLKAYYNARNGLQIALLRVKIFQQLGRLPIPPGYSKYVDQIWQFPFAWPIPLSKDINSVDRDTIKQTTDESLMEGSYTHTILDEGSKIDINDLTSPSKNLQELTKKQLINIFENQLTKDDDFRNRYQSTRFDELVNHIADWMSESNTSLGGGDKRGFFSSLGEGYPPNRGFRTLEELRLVPGMNDELFNLLAPRITIYGMKAINPNTATKEVLRALDSGMTDEAVKEVMEKREDSKQGGGFKGQGTKCLEDFKAFVDSHGGRLTKEFDKTPMVCDKTFNFRIQSTGLYGAGRTAMMKNITVVVVDLSQSATQIKNAKNNEKDTTNNGAAAGAEPDKSQAGATKDPNSGSKSGGSGQEPLPKGPPRIVYWSEN